MYQGIERIVIQSSGSMPKTDKAAGRERNLFGNYRTRTSDQAPAISLKKEEVATISYDRNHRISIAA
jgi:hypothetical protein